MQGSATEYSDRCVPLAAKRAAHGAMAVSLPVPIPPSGLARTRFSVEALRVAEVIGAVSLLNELTELTEQGKRESIEVLLRRQQLTDRILLTLLEIASATAEIVCERDRADQLADRMDEIDGARIKGLTIASIVIGGLTSIVSGGIGLAGGATVAADAANVGGGTLSSVFGVTALFTHSEVELRHKRNILKELWEDPPSPKIFSSIVWRYLHRSQDSPSDNPREGVLNAWRQKGRLGEQGSDVEQQRGALFFSEGGRYAAPELRARASMLETLEASLRLLHEELEVLIREVAQVGAEAV